MSGHAHAEVAVLHGVVRQEVRVAGLVHDGTLFDDVVAVGELGADLEVLLYQQDWTRPRP